MGLVHFQGEEETKMMVEKQKTHAASDTEQTQMSRQVQQSFGDLTLSQMSLAMHERSHVF